MKKEGKIGAHSAVTSAGRCASLLPIDVHPCRQLVTAPLIGLTPAARRPTGAGVDEEFVGSRDQGNRGLFGMARPMAEGCKPDCVASATSNQQHVAPSHSHLDVDARARPCPGAVVRGCRNEDGQPGAPNILPCRHPRVLPDEVEVGSGLEELDGQHGQGCPEGRSGRVRRRHGLERGAEMNGQP